MIIHFYKENSSGISCYDIANYISNDKIYRQKKIKKRHLTHLSYGVNQRNGDNT